MVSLAIACIGVLAGGLWAVRLAARHTLPPVARMRYGGLARLANSGLLLVVAALGLAIVYLVHSRGVVSIGRVVLIVSLIAGYMALVVTTVVFPELPGRAQFRKFENLLTLLATAGLAVVAIYGLRVGELGLPPSVFAAMAAVALSLGMFLLARPYLRGALSMMQRIQAQGSSPGTEATLKRLLRRYRPLIISAVAALLSAISFLVF